MEKEDNDKIKHSKANSPEEVVKVNPPSELQYLPAKSEKVDKTLAGKTTCKVAIEFEASQAGEQSLVASLKCDGSTKEATVTTNKTNAKSMVYLVLTETSGKVCFFRIGQKPGGKVDVRKTPVSLAKAAWDLKGQCVWLGERGEGEFAFFTKGGLSQLLKTDTETSHRLRSIRWSPRHGAYYAVGTAKTLIHCQSLTRWTNETGVVASEVSSDFMDIAFVGESSSSKIDYVIVGSQGVIVAKDTDGKFKYYPELAKQLGDSIISCIARSDSLDRFVAIAKIKKGSENLRFSHNYIICNFGNSTTDSDVRWELRGEVYVGSSRDEVISKFYYAWSRIAWSEEAQKFVCVGNAIASSPNGLDWQIQEVVGKEDQTIQLNEVIWTDDLKAFIAVGDDCSVFYSRDGDKWEVYIKPEELGKALAHASFTGVAVVDPPKD
jgi:hypothetical protein